MNAAEELTGTPPGEALVDEQVDRQLDLMGFEAGQILVLNARIDGLESRSVSALKEGDPAELQTLTGQRNRADAISAKVLADSLVVYRAENRQTNNQWTIIAGLIYGATAAATNKLLGASLMRGKLSKQGAAKIVDGIDVDGLPAAAWWRGQGVDYAKQFRSRVRQGLDATEGLTDLVARVKGTKARGYKDGISATQKRQGEAIIQTVSQSVFNESQLALYQRNDDVVRGVQAVNPLDARTSDICRARAGMAWTMDYEPFPGSDPWPGPPPWHWNCRTVLIPILKPVSQLEQVKGSRGRTVRRELKKLTPAQRRQINGQPAPNLDFEHTFEKWPAAKQRKALGPGRYKLWQEGKISMQDLIDQRGNPITLTEFQARLE